MFETKITALTKKRIPPFKKFFKIMIYSYYSMNALHKDKRIKTQAMGNILQLSCHYPFDYRARPFSQAGKIWTKMSAPNNDILNIFSLRLHSHFQNRIKSFLII